MMNRGNLAEIHMPASHMSRSYNLMIVWWVRFLAILLAVTLFLGSWARNASANGIGSIFVANHGNNSVTIIEQVHHKELITLPAPAPTPRAGAPVPTPSPEQLAIGEGPISVAFSGDGCFGYVASEGSGSIIGIDRNLYQIARSYAKVSARIRGFAVAHPDAQTDWLLIGDLPKNQLLVIDAVDGQLVRIIPLPGRPVAVASNDDGSRVYVLTEEADFVSVINPTAGVNLKTREVDSAVPVELPEIVVGPEAATLALSPKGHTLFVADPTINRVSVVDTRSGMVIRAIPTGAYPAGLAVSPDGRLLLVASRDDNTVTIYDTLRPDPGRSIPVGATPNDVAVHPSGDFAYVVNSGDSTVTVLDMPNTTREDGVPLIKVNLESFDINQTFTNPIPVRERPVAIGVAPVCGPPEAREHVQVQVADVIRVPIVVTVTEQVRVKQTVVATVIATVVVPAPTPSPVSLASDTRSSTGGSAASAGSSGTGSSGSSTSTFPKLPATGDGGEGDFGSGGIALVLVGLAALGLLVPVMRRFHRPS